MNSALNPEAPEFYPHLSSVTKDGYSAVNKTIRSSNNMPIGASFDLFKTFTDFNILKCQLSENIIVQSNQILVSELPAVKLKCNDNEYNSEKIIDANDSMLDRVNINIDTVTGVNKPDDQFLKGIKANVASWNRQSPIIAKIQVGSTTFLGAKNIPRPQLTFKDTIDNSRSLWVPRISDKPNNIKPLALNILYNDEGEAVGYEHPYQIELDLYQPKAQFIDPDPAPPTFPPPLEDTRLTFVETEAQMDELVNHLNGVSELSVDVEHHSYRTYQGITCLIQISTDEGGDFIIDTLAVREHIHKLNLAFTDPKKVKVFHGADADVLWLQRDFGVYIVGLFDTYQAAKVLKVNGLSLKYLLMKYCGVNADKKSPASIGTLNDHHQKTTYMQMPTKVQTHRSSPNIGVLSLQGLRSKVKKLVGVICSYQLADWRIRPLPAELVEYARMDTHYLLYIWRRMKAELLEAGAGQPTLLLSVFEQSRQVCGQTYNKEVVDETSHMRLYVRSKKSFNSQQMATLELLYKWRDEQARELDESTMYLLPNHMLLSLAENMPREVQGVHACCNPMPPFVKQNLITIHRMILSCRELPLEPQLYQMPASIRNMQNALHHSLASYNVHDLAHFPEFREDQQINLDQANAFLEQENTHFSDIPAFTPTYKGEIYYGVVSDLNVDAQLFIPPYDRYRKYRSIAQQEEIKEYKDKEAKVTAISKGNELIKQEVLIKIQQAKTLVENEDNNEAEEVRTEEKIEVPAAEKRKRKMSSEKQSKETVAQIAEKVEQNSKSGEIKELRSKKNKSFLYKNVNYRKFYDDSDKAHKQPKMKYKKHK